MEGSPESSFKKQISIESGNVEELVLWSDSCGGQNPQHQNDVNVEIHSAELSNCKEDHFQIPNTWKLIPTK